MLIYHESTRQFVKDVKENRLSAIMSERFFARTGRQVGRSELNSWQNSLTRVRDLIEIASLEDNMIILEYECPYNQSRIDCLLFGKEPSGKDTMVLIELKQWTEARSVEEEGNFEEIYNVETVTGYAFRLVPHPSQQIKGYQNYLKGFVSEFESDLPLALFSCVYCHNYIRKEGDGLFNPIYNKILNEFPVYTREDTVALAEKIKTLLAGGKGFEIFNRFMQSPIKPSKKLLDNVSKIVSNEAIFSLLNEQLVAKNLIWGKLRRAKAKKKKSIIIVHGGPGTGKSLIAINILAEAAQKKHRYNVLYGCKSKPFISGLKDLVGANGRLLFTNLYRFLPSKTKEDEFDLILIDEAHRIEKSSNFQYTKAVDKTDMPQIEQLIRCAKIAVFFIDDRQNVRSQEIGSSQLIRTVAEQYDIDVSHVTLETQYRCMGSNDYLLWIESILGYEQTNRKLLQTDKFDFRIFDSPTELYNVILEKEKEKPNSARLVAGFCWPWSDPMENGELVKDVVIGDFAMPWEAKEGFKLAKGTPKWYEWGYKAGGINQVGCIYTVQGFEYDFIGVIIGNDMTFDSKTNRLKSNIDATYDPTLKKYPANFESHVRNIYRVLLTRGMKGCYIYCMDKELEKYLRLRLALKAGV